MPIDCQKGVIDESDIDLQVQSDGFVDDSSDAETAFQQQKTEDDARRRLLMQNEMRIIDGSSADDDDRSDAQSTAAFSDSTMSIKTSKRTYSIDMNSAAFQQQHVMSQQRLSKSKQELLKESIMRASNYDNPNKDRVVEAAPDMVNEVDDFMQKTMRQRETVSDGVETRPKFLTASGLGSCMCCCRKKYFAQRGFFFLMVF